MSSERMTIVLTETGTLTAAVLELVRVARAITRTREKLGLSAIEIAATKKRLGSHLDRFRTAHRLQQRRLRRQQRELSRQIKRLKDLKPSTLNPQPSTSQ